MADSPKESSDMITKEILVKAIANDKGVQGSKVCLKSWELDKGARPGENIVTDVYAVHLKAIVDGKDHEFDYIIKARAVDESRKSMFQKSTLFNDECDFYNSILPKLNYLREKVNLPPLKIPKAFYASKEDDVVVMENLKKEGYDTFDANSIEGLSTECIEIGLKNLAQYHATCFHFVQTYPGGEDQLGKDHPCYDPVTLHERVGKEGWSSIKGFLISRHIPHMLDVLKKCSNLDDIFEKQIENLEERIEAARHVSPSSFTTICHGDSKTPNMLFKMNQDGTVNNIRLIDFQILHKTSPTLDIGHLFYGSVHPNLIRDQQESWFVLYHKALICDLSTFGYSKEIFTLNDLKNDFKKTQYYGYCFAFHSLVDGLLGRFEEFGEYDQQDEAVKKIISFVELAKEQGI